ncbi:ABC transporter substrate-binding protein [Leifsonia sp. Root227]|uniref:ABC transporter permease n=1 Tax=Leifsonia sp. Root227 TaxID=1736496 RepID=UPI0006F588A1|nr:ABC transporter permease [Leifsonia sp. Root227]KRC47011.1 ABC transporter substrate-binding protein [Leifsonia sp. Root227]
MFVAWRDLRFARGRFILIGAVVALITVLVGFLAGLTGGLAFQNVSAVLDLPGNRLVLQQTDGKASFSESELSENTVDAWRSAPGVDEALPVSILQSRAQADGKTAGVAVFGMPSGDDSALGRMTPHTANEIGLSTGAAADLDARVGDRVSIAGTAYRVASVGGDLWYSHTPAIAMTTGAARDTAERMGGSGAATVLAVSGDPDWDAVAKATGTVAFAPLASLTALETFKSEIGSLALMVVMLFGISALVVGAFFTVWTMQRSGDIAVLKALGATTGSLVRDALGQALVVLVVGIGIGLAAVVGLGALAGGALPFLISPLTTIVPALAMAVLGLAGAAVALRTVTSADPLTALGSNR